MWSILLQIVAAFNGGRWKMVELDEKKKKKKSGGILASSLCFKIRERKTETPISKKKKKRT